MAWVRAGLKASAGRIHVRILENGADDVGVGDPVEAGGGVVVDGFLRPEGVEEGLGVAVGFGVKREVGAGIQGPFHKFLSSQVGTAAGSCGCCPRAYGEGSGASGGGGGYAVVVQKLVGGVGVVGDGGGKVVEDVPVRREVCFVCEVAASMDGESHSPEVFGDHAGAEDLG